VVIAHFLRYDYEARRYYKSADTKTKLTETQINRWLAQASVFNAINMSLQQPQIIELSKSELKALWIDLTEQVQSLEMSKVGLDAHRLGKNAVRLREKFNRYNSKGYASLIHSGLGNGNSKKIQGDVASWLLATYSLPQKITINQLARWYDNIRKDNNWPTLTPSAIGKWLKEPEQSRLWVVSRHGKDAYQNRFGYKLKRNKEKLFPNAWWAIDGSKLDWLHFEDNAMGMAARQKVNLVVDIYSEKILGWHISETENHVAHFLALKMAVNQSGMRPYLLTYDNQSGHKSTRMQRLYSSVVAINGGVHAATQPYRHSNPLEQIIGRFQRYVLNQMWFSDKQSVKASLADSHWNYDFVLANKHKLKDKKELFAVFEYCVDQWNKGAHSRIGTTRAEAFASSAPMQEPFSLFEKADLFWVKETKPKKYYPWGIPLTVAGKRYEYEVYATNGEIDLDFRSQYMGKKFIVKYDPQHLNDFVQLWQLAKNSELQFIANAQPKRAHQQVPVLMSAGDKSKFLQDFKVTELEFERDLAQIKNARFQMGLTDEKLIKDQELAVKLGVRMNKENQLVVKPDTSHFAEGL
jgi:hypothetical protein